MGSFLIMGLFGIIIAVAGQHLPGSLVLQFVISVIGVLVFAGLTAYDTQRLKDEYVYGAMDGEVMAGPPSWARCRSTSTSSTCS